MKRIALFLMTNLAVVVTLSIVAQILGLDRIMGAQGLNFVALLGFAALFGFGGALLSLAMSKWSAKMAVGAHVIDHPSTTTEAWLVDTVARQASAAGIGIAVECGQGDFAAGAGAGVGQLACQQLRHPCQRIVLQLAGLVVGGPERQPRAQQGDEANGQRQGPGQLALHRLHARQPAYAAAATFHPTPRTF